MTNALAPLSILLSFVMGIVAFDDAPMALFATDEDGEPLASKSGPHDSVGQGKQVVIASKPPGARFFFLDADVNGVQTRFLVDTGATTMVLRRSDAEQASVAAGGPIRMQTANGKVAVEQTSIDTLKIGEIVLSDVHAVVADDRLPHSLIGLNALDKIGRIVIDESSMTVLLNASASAE